VADVAEGALEVEATTTPPPSMSPLLFTKNPSNRTPRRARLAVSGTMMTVLVNSLPLLLSELISVRSPGFVAVAMASATAFL
jgi:hypothetical protein